MIVALIVILRRRTRRCGGRERTRAKENWRKAKTRKMLRGRLAQNLIGKS